MITLCRVSTTKNVFADLLIVVGAADPVGFGWLGRFKIRIWKKIESGLGIGLSIEIQNTSRIKLESDPGLKVISNPDSFSKFVESGFVSKVWYNLDTVWTSNLKFLYNRPFQKILISYWLLYWRQKVEGEPDPGFFFWIISSDCVQLQFRYFYKVLVATVNIRIYCEKSLFS